MNNKTSWEVIVAHEGKLASVVVEADGLGGAEREALALYPGWAFVMAQSVFLL